MKLQLCRIREVLDHVHGAIARTDTDKFILIYGYWY
jgi:hypothetical protein